MVNLELNSLLAEVPVMPFDTFGRHGYILEVFVGEYIPFLLDSILLVIDRLLFLIFLHVELVGLPQVAGAVDCGITRQLIAGEIEILGGFEVGGRLAVGLHLHRGVFAQFVGGLGGLEGLHQLLLELLLLLGRDERGTAPGE